MATITFPSLAHSHTIPASNHRYTYLYSPPTTPSLPTILFLHGFPSSSYDWRHQIPFFTAKGYGVLVPDLLGYGQFASTTANSDKLEDDVQTQPTDLAEYKAKTMSADLIALLDHEGICSPVHAVGHDIGCYLLSKLANYYPTRLASVAFLTVPYSKPGERFDVDAVIAMMQAFLGFERFGYLRFFVGEEAAGLIEEHMESFFSLFYPADPNLWIEHLGATGACETWLRNDRRAPLAPYVTEEEKSTHLQIMRGHYQSALMWYRALVWNINIDDELEANLDPNLPQPVLMVTSKPGPLNPPGGGEMMKPFVENLTVRQIEAEGHWVQLEAREEVNGVLLEFIEGCR
ncbi:hypothetical protein AJ79_06688 [Helicocarpus griseus UAMH5409]|uniref:AB hydrolase-1 domain-containing protein n=1 Tax=Helicocarpus griseus UAMH5409 TaxID=1447875 RepID=A0A2B7X9R6_9EURO|nr:hypothetical protein AJ79_06688 [Helicocarpus griseus UAMH5409]